MHCQALLFLHVDYNTNIVGYIENFVLHLPCHLGLYCDHYSLLSSQLDFTTLSLDGNVNGSKSTHLLCSICNNNVYSTTYMLAALLMLLCNIMRRYTVWRETLAAGKFGEFIA